MKITYEVPPHLVSYFEDLTQKGIDKILTVLLEIAVNQRMVDYPKLHIEKQIDAFANTIRDIYHTQKESSRMLLDEIKLLSNRLNNMSIQQASTHVIREVAPMEDKTVDVVEEIIEGAISESTESDEEMLLSDLLG